MPLARFLFRRLSHAALAVAGVVTVVFLALRLAPGDPVENLLGEQALEADKDALRDQLCLDRPWHEQYFVCFLGELFDGSLGYAYGYEGGRVPVATLIGERLAPTVELALASLLVAILLAVPLGLASAMHQHRWLDHGAMIFALVGVAMPGFWLGPMLIHLFCVKLDWLPNPADDMQGFSSLMLPAIVLGCALAARLTRLVRSSALEILQSDFIVAARSRGLGDWTILRRYVLRNALIPVVTVLGMQLAALLAGTIVIEKVFARPGIGTLLLEGVARRDYALVQGCVLVVSLGYVVINLLVDILYTVIDPRIRVSGGR